VHGAPILGGSTGSVIMIKTASYQDHDGTVCYRKQRQRAAVGPTCHAAAAAAASTQR
jgi:hypothetical protein